MGHPACGTRDLWRRSASGEPGPVQIIVNEIMSTLGSLGG